MAIPMDLSSQNSDILVQLRLNSSQTGSKIVVTGIAIALLIISLWALNLGFLLTTINIGQTHLSWYILAILSQTFLYTGLFITAHDAMHGAVFPKHHQINNLIGSLALLLYGFFSYDHLLKKHSQHHHAPATDFDPDFHDGKHKNLIAWYIHFIQRYWSWRRLGCLILAYYSMHIFLHIAYANLILFWAIPVILSSMQLFYFGTFIPHREPIGGYQNPSRTQSVYRPLLWSFLTCYHFGYHEEHHMYPDVPWWQLSVFANK
jgi:beta-carotene ketolase (CrtW type)